MQYHDGTPQRKSRPWLKNITLMLAGGLAVAGLMVGLEAVRTGDRLLTTITNLLTNPQPDPAVNVQTVVIQQIRNASELTTAVFTMQAVVPTSQDAVLHGFVVGTTRLLYIAHGEVQAGVDLSQLNSQNIQVSGDRIRLQLPPPRILNSKIDVNRSRVYDYDRGFFSLGPDTAPELQSLAQQEALKKVVQTACTNGILEQARDRANLVVTQLLNGAGYKSVIVESQPVSQEQCQG
jgi:hypothetical protein